MKAVEKSAAETRATGGIEVEVRDDLGDDELTRIMDLLRIAYPAVETGIWDWQYGRRSLGTPRVALARADGKIVGVQPSIRQDVLWSGRSATGYQLCHVVTHPEYRRRGIFTKLVSSFAERAEREGAAYVYTFPNRLSFPGFQRTRSWDHPFSLPLWVRLALGSGRSSRATRSLGVPQPVEHFDPAVDVLARETAGRFPAGRVRDHRYLEWRYLEHPERPYVVLALRDGSLWRGVVAGRLVDWLGVRSGAVVEMLGDPSSLDRLLAALEAELARRGARTMGCLMPGGRAESQVLERRGYRVLPAWMLRKEFYFVLRASGGVPPSLRDMSAWWLTWGDNDIV